MRLITFLLVAGVLCPAAAAQKLQLDHPTGSAAVLAADLTTGRMVYRGDQELIFESANRIRRVSLGGQPTHLTASSSGEFIGAVLRHSSSDSVALRVFDHDGRIQWEKRIAHHHDDRIPQLALSNSSGYVAYARPTSADVCFVVTASAEPICRSLFRDAAFSLERNVLIDYSPDGRYVAIAAQQEAARPGLTGSNVTLFLFDAEGTLLREFDLPERSIRALAFLPFHEGATSSPSDRATSSSFDRAGSPPSDRGALPPFRLAVSTYDSHAGPEVIERTRLISIEGEMIAESTLGADAFAFTEGRVLLITSRKVAAMDSDESRLLYQAPAGMHVISAVDANGAVVLAGRNEWKEDGFVLNDLFLMRLDESGQVLFTQAIDFEPQRAARLWMEKPGGRIAVTLDDVTQFYELPR